MSDAAIGLNYWWQKYQRVVKLLSTYMRENKIKTVDEAIEHLLTTKE